MNDFKIFIILLTFLFCGTTKILAQTDNDYYLKAIEMVRNNDFANALIQINKALDKAPQNNDYLAYQAYILRNTLNYTDALVSIEKAIAINDKIGWYYVEAVVIAYELKNLSLAKQYAKKAFSFGKDNLGTSNYDYIVAILQNLKTVEYTLNFKFEPNNKNLVYQKDGSLCIPVPSTDLPYQKSKYKLTNATLIKTVKENDTELIYIKPTGTTEVSILCTVTKIPYSYSSEITNSLAKNTTYSEEIKKYLEGADRFDLNSLTIKTTAKSLKASTDLETIKNIVNWINTSKTYNAIPPTWTIVDDILKSSTVECGTGSLAVVVLARTCGIPARQVWGPIDAGKDFAPKNYLKGHVWFEFYLKGLGWIPMEQFDKSSLGTLPLSYIRIMTSYSHLYDNIPLGNIMTIMNDATYGDIIKYEKKIIED